MGAFLPLAVGGGLKLLGGLLGNKSKSKAQEANFGNQQAMLDYQAALKNRQDQADEQRRVLRGSLFKGLANAWGLGNLIPTDYSKFSTTVRPGIPAPHLQNPGTGTSFMGDVFGELGSLAIAKYLGDRYNQAEGGGGLPATVAAANGGVYGPMPENPYVRPLYDFTGREGVSPYSEGD